MKFSSTNQPKPENRSGGKTDMFTRIVAALERRFESGQDGCDTFEDWLVMKAIDEGGVYLQEMLKRVSPAPKQSFNPVHIEFPENGTPAQKADAVLKAMADGQISPDVGHVFIDAISKSLGIEEVTELAKRLDAIEKKLNAKEA
jgi:hypothetical protein